MTNGNIRELIKLMTIPIGKVEDNRIGSFKWLSDEIYNGKAKIELNSVKFVIIKILNRQNEVYDFRKRPSFDVYVIGSFRKTFTPILKVAEAFARYYLEMHILPNIIPIPRHLIKQNKDVLLKLKNGVLIYERR